MLKDTNISQHITVFVQLRSIQIQFRFEEENSITTNEYMHTRSTSSAIVPVERFTLLNTSLLNFLRHNILISVI